MANINRAQKILVNNTNKITGNALGGLFINLSSKMANNVVVKNPIREIGEFLQGISDEVLKEKLNTKFGRYGNRPTKISKKTLAIARRLKEIYSNGKYNNKKLGNVNGNNKNIENANVANNSTPPLPTRAEILFYIFVYISTNYKFSARSGNGAPQNGNGNAQSGTSTPQSGTGNASFEQNFNEKVNGVFKGMNFNPSNVKWEGVDPKNIPVGKKAEIRKREELKERFGQTKVKVE